MTIYKNPESGEVVETKGGNYRTLKEWKAEYGSDTVESWLTSEFGLSTKGPSRGPFLFMCVDDDMLENLVSRSSGNRPRG